jgi:hypothetical protein
MKHLNSDEFFHLKSEARHYNSLVEQLEETINFLANVKIKKQHELDVKLKKRMESEETKKANHVNALRNIYKY